MMKIRSNDIKKLLDTGWQSWSYNVSPKLKFPLFNFNPKANSKFIPSFKPDNKKGAAYGWCSWYVYGSSINEKK